MKRGRPPTDFAARCPVRQDIASRRALGPLGRFFQSCWLLESVCFHCSRYHRNHEQMGDLIPTC